MKFSKFEVTILHTIFHTHTHTQAFTFNPDFLFSPLNNLLVRSCSRRFPSLSFSLSLLRSWDCLCWDMCWLWRSFARAFSRHVIVAPSIYSARVMAHLRWRVRWLGCLLACALGSFSMLVEGF